MTLGHWGFSWTGLLFLALLMAPNLLWTKNKPKGYSAAGEDRRLLALERIGEAGTACNQKEAVETFFHCRRLKEYTDRNLKVSVRTLSPNCSSYPRLTW